MAIELSFVLPTRDRADVLLRTLDALNAYLAAFRQVLQATAQVVLVEDAAERPVDPPARLECGVPIDLVRLDRRRGAAARNAGVDAASGAWVVMLDDDSHPECGDIASVLESTAAEVAVVGFGITLPAQRRREDGGLPEVHIGCGAAIRRDAFRAVGGYDEAFDYYAEEYDLCARLIARGHAIEHDFRVGVAHHKVAVGRDMNRILRRLVRNNGWIMQRYAPDAELGAALAEVRTRYQRVAEREGAVAGYETGRADLEDTLAAQARTPLAPGQWDRFIGAAAARRGLAEVRDETVALVAPGKNASVIRSILEAQRCELVEPECAERLVVGTLSPGPMLDAVERHEGAVTAWRPRSGRGMLRAGC